jgi:hypothetical protein
MYHIHYHNNSMNNKAKSIHLIKDTTSRIQKKRLTEKSAVRFVYVPNKLRR